MPPSTTQQVFDAYTKQLRLLHRELFGGKLRMLAQFQPQRLHGALRPRPLGIATVSAARNSLNPSTLVP